MLPLWQSIKAVIGNHDITPTPTYGSRISALKKPKQNRSLSEINVALISKNITNHPHENWIKKYKFATKALPAQSSFTVQKLRACSSEGLRAAGGGAGVGRRCSGARRRPSYRLPDPAPSPSRARTRVHFWVCRALVRWRGEGGGGGRGRTVCRIGGRRGGWRWRGRGAAGSPRRGRRGAGRRRERRPPPRARPGA